MKTGRFDRKHFSWRQMTGLRQNTRKLLAATTVNCSRGNWAQSWKESWLLVILYEVLYPGGVQSSMPETILGQLMTQQQGWQQHVEPTWSSIERARLNTETQSRIEAPLKKMTILNCEIEIEMNKNKMLVNSIYSVHQWTHWPKVTWILFKGTWAPCDHSYYHTHSFFPSPCLKVCADFLQIHTMEKK